jgi:hypothetical protein
VTPNLRRIAAAAAAIACLAPAVTFAQGKAPAPPAGLLDTFPGCQWGEVKGTTLSIWSLSCGPQSGNAHLTADDQLPGFVLETSGADGTSRKIVIRAFTKPATAPIASVLPAIHAASPGADTDTCALVRFNDDDAKRFARGAQTFTFAPTGAAKTAWDKAEKEGGDAPAPCGDLGIYFDRAPLFWMLRGDPTMVIAADMGSEIQIFDPATLRRVK